MRDKNKKKWKKNRWDNEPITFNQIISKMWVVNDKEANSEKNYFNKSDDMSEDLKK